MGKTRQTANLTSNITISSSNVGIGSTIPKSKLNVVGIISATSFVGDGSGISGIIVSYAAEAGISTISQGLSGTPNINVTSIAATNVNVSGVSTLNNVIVGGATTALLVNGNARIVGVLTVGSSSIVFDGTNNTINVGSGTTISSSGIIGNGANLTGLNASNITTGILSTARFDPNSNGYGTRTISASQPSGGSNGDLWFVV